MEIPVQIRRCAPADVALLEAREPAGQGFARHAAARQERGESTFLIAWSGELPVGSCEVDEGELPLLKNLSVDAPTRGRGVGSRLMEAAEELARPRGRIACAVGLDNPRARRLYERRGYRATGQLETVSYEYVDDGGVRRTATETSETLVKDLGNP
ncbi:GNAT family N-acetyltransferase [Brachybacterium sp. NBEC-018]|uniref:GNAT family N-acetyltransferase n=1 Tax=Brachybacterium sp. NBEC-018 TaxID=2996004 RepID=UPI0021754B57|nr:GNAT family N-acetyltransferase [Brachybacterium sp. NBEC-018]UVY85376.1 GNAT family N-acetyltransferase [Brachybacterium sp. NBEC-018]